MKLEKQKVLLREHGRNCWMVEKQACFNT